jgi:hypothetical protein
MHVCGFLRRLIWLGGWHPVRHGGTGAWFGAEGVVQAVAGPADRTVCKRELQTVAHCPMSGLLLPLTQAGGEGVAGGSELVRGCCCNASRVWQPFPAQRTHSQPAAAAAAASRQRRRRCPARSIATANNFVVAVETAVHGT